MSSAVKVIYGMRADEAEQEKARIRQKSLYDLYSSISFAEKRRRKERFACICTNNILIFYCIVI